VNVVTNQAWVAPLQGWTKNGLAHVQELVFPPRPSNPIIIPLLNVEQGQHTIKRVDFPIGVVLIPQGYEPTGPSAVLPLEYVTGDQYPAQLGKDSANPNGVVILFKSS
jgi:hypothetical protein